MPVAALISQRQEKERVRAFKCKFSIRFRRFALNASRGRGRPGDQVIRGAARDGRRALQASRTAAIRVPRKAPPIEPRGCPVACLTPGRTSTSFTVVKS